jgi:hypothetical protein
MHLLLQLAIPVAAHHHQRQSPARKDEFKLLNQDRVIGKVHALAQTPLKTKKQKTAYHLEEKTSYHTL